MFFLNLQRPSTWLLFLQNVKNRLPIQYNTTRQSGVVGQSLIQNIKSNDKKNLPKYHSAIRGTIYPRKNFSLKRITLFFFFINQMTTVLSATPQWKRCKTMRQKLAAKNCIILNHNVLFNRLNAYNIKCVMSLKYCKCSYFFSTTKL